MIVYNLTFKVDLAIHAQWLRWQQEEHIPEVMATGLFSGHRVYRLLEQDESEGITYVIQYQCRDLQQYQEYISRFAPLLRKKAQAKWGDRLIAFRTVMTSVAT